MTISVTVVGPGNIGCTLARRFAAAGMEVTLASRDPGTAVIGEPPLRRIDESLTGADVVVLAIPGVAVAQFLDAHRPALAGLPVVDATNTPGAPVMHHAQVATGIDYFRAFNTLGVENYADPSFEGGPADMFYSGPTQGAQIVEALIEAVGMRPVHVGSGVAAADVLDGITRLWFTLALQQGRGRHLAFRTLS